MHGRCHFCGTLERKRNWLSKKSVKTLLLHLSLHLHFSWISVPILNSAIFSQFTSLFFYYFDHVKNFLYSLFILLSTSKVPNTKHHKNDTSPHSSLLIELKRITVICTRVIGNWQYVISSEIWSDNLWGFSLMLSLLSWLKSFNSLHIWLVLDRKNTLPIVMLC